MKSKLPSYMGYRRVAEEFDLFVLDSKALVRVGPIVDGLGVLPGA